MSLEECPCCRPYKMFFQVAADALKIDPSCEPGKIDPMCTADAIHQLRNDLSRSEELNRELVEELEECLASEETAHLDGFGALYPTQVKRIKHLLARVKEMGK